MTAAGRTGWGERYGPPAPGGRGLGIGVSAGLKALILYSKSGGLQPLAQAVAASLRELSVHVDVKEAEEQGGGPIAVAAYELICVGSPVLGFWGGQVAADVDATIKRCTRMEGKQVAAFVKPKAFGTAKALRRLMGILERQGALVQDFAALRGAADARAFGRRLENLVRKKP